MLSKAQRGDDMTAEEMEEHTLWDEQSRYATAVLFMCSVGITLNGHDLTVYVFPRECLDKVHNLFKAGASIRWLSAAGCRLWRPQSLESLKGTSP